MARVKKLLASKCPTCLERVTARDQSVRDNTESDDRKLNLLRRRKNSEKLKALAISEQLVCPNGHVLPFDFWDIDVHSFALVGQSRSMKSHYIEATFYELLDSNRAPLTSMGITVEDAPETREMRHVRYRRPVRQDGRIIARSEFEANDGFGWPLSMRLNISTDAVRQKSSVQRVYATLFDAPGEALVEMSDTARHAGYISEADGIAVFVDVNSLASVREALGDSTDPESVLFDTSVFANVERLRNAGGRQSRRCPVAVVFSRADQLSAIDDPTLNDFLSTRGPELDRAAIAQDASYPASYFASSYARNIFDLANQKFDSVGFFLASAVGSQPVDGRIDNPTSFGCVESFAWLLNQSQALY